jgi:hypothetical protein
MLLWLAEAIEPEPRRSLLRSAFALWAATAAVGVMFVVLLAAVLSARRARRRVAAGQRPRRRRGRPIPDAWAEAGRRAVPIRMDEPPPEVIDEPPSDGPAGDRS